MASTEEDFPRGGKTKQTTESKAEPVRRHTEVDNLFESLKVGTLLLGCVKEVADLEVTINLPSGLLGYLNISNISDSYTKILSDHLDSASSEEIFSLASLFSPGMLVRCVVARLDTAKGGSVSIQLSINPKEINKGLTTGSLKAGLILSGCVESIEDHGYLVDLGIKGTKAFLPKTLTSSQLKVGQYVTSLLEEVKNDERVVRLSISPTAVAQAVADTAHGWTLTNLLPGLLVKVTLHGLILEFLSSFTGLVDFMHLEPEQASTFKEGDNVKACVLYVEPSTRLVGLSLRSHLLQPGGDVDLVATERIGEVAHGCKMTALHHLSGAMLELPDQTVVFVHRNHMKEPMEAFNLNRVMAKPEHTCRIMDFSPMEQVHLVSLRQSIVDAPFFRRYHDIQPGQIVQGTVTSLQNHGMMVKVTDYIRGLVPRTHLSDIILKNPEKQYAVGMIIKCQVLSVDPQAKKLTLTRKRALIDSSLPPFLTYEDARRGRVSHGFIVCVKDFGCIVCFYGKVKGLVPPNELSTEPVVVPGNVFYVGQVVKAKVLNCDVEKEKLLLSFKAVAGGDTERPPKPKFDFEVGKVRQCKFLTGLEVSILPEETPALLPMMHLSDHMSNCLLLWEGLQEGDIISNIVCLSKKKQIITLTKKPTLKSFLEEGVVVAKEFSDITVGVQLIGWVNNIMPYGVFVEFPYGLVGLAPKAAMSDKFVGDTAAHFQLGHTVVAKVTNLDEEKHRFLVSLKVSDVPSPERDGQARLIRGLQERKAVMEMMASRGDSDLLKQLSAVTIGQRMKMSVDEVREDGSVTFKSDELSAATVLATKDHAPGKLATGQECMPVILHVDLVTSEVYVSLMAKLTGKRKVEAGSTHTATVHHADRDFAVISLGDTAQLTVIQTTNHLNETFRFDAEKLTAGKTLAITVTKSSCEELEGLPLVSWELAPPISKRLISNSKRSKGMYRYGDMVKGKVKTVKPTCVLVTLEDGSTGCVHVSEIQEVVCVGTFPTSFLKIGSEVTARVIGGREGNNNLSLSGHRNLKEDADVKPVKTKEKLKRYQVGDDVICFVSKVSLNKRKLKCPIILYGSVFTLIGSLKSFICIIQGAKHPEKLFKLGQAVSAKVVTVSSSKPSRLSLSLNGVHKLEKGHVIMGLVQKLDPVLGLLVKLPFSAMGTVAMEDLADKYKPKPLERYSKDQLVRSVAHFKPGLKANWTSLKVSQVKMKASVVQDPEIVSLEDLSEGQIVRGYVRTVNAQGVFVSLSRSIKGRAQFQKATKYFVASHQDYAKKVPQATLLSTKILSIDKESGLVDLSLLQEDTGKPDVLPESLGLHLRLTGEAKEKRDATKKRKRTESESKQGTVENVSTKKKKKKKKGKGEDSDSGVEVYFREEEEENKLEPAEVEKPVPVQPARLQVTGGFSWDAALSALKPASAALGGEDSSDGEDGEVNTKPQKKSHHEQEVEKREAEKALTKLETELMDPGLRPQTAASFERLLLGSPDSSLLWLQFMAFHLQATQIEQARAVAERALKTISFREEQEKLNVWVALLNLENLYGTEESLQKVFERAVQYCEPMPVYQQLADIYAKCQKTKEAEGLYKTMVKRFRQEKAVWLSYGTFLLQQGQSDAASALLQRAIKSLPNKDNVDLIAKFAQLEFRYGDVERGKAMLDRILTSYPKRTDLWSVFIDLMVKHGSQKEVRAVFDRVIHLSVAVKRIKFFFKRYLEYEKKSGTPESIQAVKDKALEYVESKGTEAAR
uniref:Protein RRP5 homolog n=1 Tax=Oncorhynchus kisutch TaxID=8019 RepID=A0A8C7HW95_ONCKI